MYTCASTSVYVFTCTSVCVRGVLYMCTCVLPLCACTRMYVTRMCTSVYMFVCVYVHNVLYACIHVCDLCVYPHVCMCTRVPVQVRTCLRVCLCTWRTVYVCTCVCDLCVCMYTHILTRLDLSEAPNKIIVKGRGSGVTLTRPDPLWIWTCSVTLQESDTTSLLLDHT